MNKILLLPILSTLACATSTPSYTPVVDPSRYVEAAPLPKLPEQEPMPEEIPPDEWAMELEATDTHGAGILISERKAWILATYFIKYEELRTIVESNNKVISVQRSLYEETVKNLRTEVDALQPTWYDRNKAYVWGSVGLVVGAGLTYKLAN